MKNVYRILYILLPLLLILNSGCSSDEEVTMQEVRVLVTGSYIANTCNINVTSDGVLTIIEETRHLNSDQYIKTKKLSKRNMKKVDKLIDNVKKNSRVEDSSGATDAIEAYITINDTNYYTFLDEKYSEDSSDIYVDKDAQELAYTLLKLAPKTKAPGRSPLEAIETIWKRQTLRRILQ